MGSERYTRAFPVGGVFQLGAGKDHPGLGTPRTLCRGCQVKDQGPPACSEWSWDMEQSSQSQGSLRAHLTWHRISPTDGETKGRGTKQWKKAVCFSLSACQGAASCWAGPARTACSTPFQKSGAITSTAAPHPVILHEAAHSPACAAQGSAAS